jgi:DNA topoisomerase-6 subunit A
MKSKNAQAEPSLKALQKLALSIIEKYKKSGELKIRVPIRGTSNITFDKKLRQYVLSGNTKELDIKNLAVSKAFTQRAWLIWFIANELVAQGKSATLRDIFYSAQAFGLNFEEQGLSDQAIYDIEAIVGMPREDLHIFPEERSAIYGDMVIQYIDPKYKAKKHNLSDHPDGVSIGPALTEAKFVSCKADKVLVVEKNAIFTRFVEDEAYKKFNALVVGLGGQAPRNARVLIRRLNQELGLPVYVFVDADPWGMAICNTITAGSAAAAHLTGLTTPDAVYCGVWPSDIKRFNLPSDPLKDVDLKRLEDMKHDPRYTSGIWKRELEVFSREKRKTELEAFAKHRLSFLVDEYLPQRLKELKSG